MSRDSHLLSPGGSLRSEQRDQEEPMKATVMHGAGDVRTEEVPDPGLIEPTDAVMRVTRACICGSDLWPYKTLEPSDEGRIMGHEALGVVEEVGAEVDT